MTSFKIHLEPYYLLCKNRTKICKRKFRHNEELFLRKTNYRPEINTPSSADPYFKLRNKKNKTKNKNSCSKRKNRIFLQPKSEQLKQNKERRKTLRKSHDKIKTSSTTFNHRNNIMIITYHSH